MIRERRILSGRAGERPGRRPGRGREQRTRRRSGAEAESRDVVKRCGQEGSRRLCVTEAQILRPGKNPKASLVFGEL